MVQAGKRLLYKFVFIGLVLVPALFSGQALYSQDGYLYLPILSFGNATQVGVALSNPTLYDVDLELALYSDKGSLVQAPQLENPASLTLPPRGQTARLLTEIFGAGIVGQKGWIEII